jgi:hypothetical protein
MYKSIILSACLFGSFYLCSISLSLINKSYLENVELPKELIIINGLTFLVSGLVVCNVIFNSTITIHNTYFNR